ncbi:MAG: hypothetical protein A3F17_00135 [Gammaproteobacteria bacterium RIFCSPHIGHO2_12_FULL_41_15]|nr:MAG: hypothetical protein A3F17_00135 [Gammaproteobacteria bacterium RIFCSPHIGHO2_12_FULL_41_15]
MNRILCLLILCLSVTSLRAASYCQFYPHWKNCAASESLMQIEKMIAAHEQDKNQLAFAFDWDGTLYNEQIPLKNNPTQKRSGQSTWRRWAADQIQFKNAQHLFPFLRPHHDKKNDQQLWAENLRVGDDLVESKLANYALSSDLKTFTTIATLPAGMRVADYIVGVNQYLNDYPVEKNAYQSVFDIFQRLQNKGFTPWIITGSNPYFVATVLHRVNQRLAFNVMPQCTNYIDAILHQQRVFRYAHFMQVCHIAGNAAEVNSKGQFSWEYDRRFVLNSKSAIVDKQGKWLAAQYIARHSSPIFFYAGNSDGDAAIISALLMGKTGQSNSAAMFVNPEGKLLTAILNTNCQHAACITVKGVGNEI